MPTIVNDGQAVHYLDAGAGPRTLIFMHGFLMDCEMFEHQIAALVETHRCLSIDARGFGESRPVTQDFSMWDLARDALAVMDHVEIDRAVWCGHSQGGYAALRAALESPGRISGILLVNSSAAPQRPNTVATLSAVAAGWSTDQFDDLAGPLAASLIGDESLERKWVERWRQRRYVLDSAAKALISRDDISHRLMSIRVPVALVHGGRDGTIPEDDRRFVEGALPQCVESISIPTAAHAAPVTHGAEVTAALARLIASI